MNSQYDVLDGLGDTNGQATQNATETKMVYV